MELKSILTKEEKTNRVDFSLPVKIVVSSLAIVYLAFRIDWGAFLQHLREMNLFFVTLSFATVIASIIVSGYKWYILCKLHGNVSFHECFRWYYIGFFSNNFLPGSIGGDILRIFFASKKLGSQQAIASVTVERLFAGIALLTCSVTGFIFFRAGGSVHLQILVFITILILVYSFIFAKPFQQIVKKLVGEKVAPFYETIETYKQHKGTLGKLIILSFAFQLCYIFVSSFLFLALDVTVPFIAQVGFISLISILTMIPISINGIGVREGAYVFLFATLGVAESISLAVSLMFFVLVLIGTSIGGIIWTFEKNKVKTKE